MAERSQPLTVSVWAGVFAALVFPALILAAFAAVLLSAELGRVPSASDWAAVRFTLVQALVSAVISVLLAIPVARALARRRFPGRAFLVTLLGAPFLLPVIVAIFGLLAVFGAGGIVNAALGWFGFSPISIYGFHGVVLAHVFFNMPLATRLVLQGWAEIPSERFRLAASLGMDASAVNRHLERPMLKAVVPGVTLVIFVICTTSFAVALTLGGGPSATTIELAIYQAVRFEFDLARASYLSMFQIAITVFIALFALRYGGPAGVGAGLDRGLRRWDSETTFLRVVDVFAISVATLFLIAPIVMVVARGYSAIPFMSQSVWTAALTSIAVALGSTVLTVVLAFAIGLAATRLRARGRFLEIAGLLAIAASPLVIGTGLFLMIFPFAEPARFALGVTVLVNAMMTLPFALRAILPAIRNVEADYGRLADSLGLVGWDRLRMLILPRIRRPLGFAAGLGAALSMGDLGVIALFANTETATLPLQVYRLMGAYRMEEAGAAAVLLLLLTFGIFYAFDRWMSHDADA